MLSKKQQKAIKVLNYLITSGDFPLQIVEQTDEDIKAFFNYTDRGLFPLLETKGFIELVHAHKWLAQVKADWKEGFEQGYLHPQDFKDEPEELQEEAKKVCIKTKRKWGSDSELH